jgi:hypothetical protein
MAGTMRGACRFLIGKETEMLNPLQEVLSRSAGRAENSIRPVRAGKITVAFVGRLISVAAVAAFVIAAIVVLTFGFPIGELSSVGLFLGVWAGVMLPSAFAILAIVRYYEREGTVPAFALGVARIKLEPALVRAPRAAP